MGMRQNFPVLWLAVEDNRSWQCGGKRGFLEGGGATLDSIRVFTSLLI